MAEKAIPWLTVCLGGTLVNTAPEPTAHAPWLIIRLNGVNCGLIPIPEGSDKNFSFAGSDDNNKEVNSDGPERDEDEDDNNDCDDDNLLNEVDKYCKKGGNNGSGDEYEVSKSLHHWHIIAF